MLIVTLVPAVYPVAAHFVFTPNALVVLYALLSLAIALVVFGVLGDSEALIRLTPATGQLVQVSGSAGRLHRVLLYVF